MKLLCEIQNRLLQLKANKKIIVYFTIVGSVGFIIDSGLLTLLSSVYLINVYLSRLMSFSAAVFITWIINRRLVFKSVTDITVKKSDEYIRYLIVQIGGALANLFIFAILILNYPSMKETPILPLFMGAFFGLIINFTGSRYWVFSKHRNQEIHD